MEGKLLPIKAFSLDVYVMKIRKYCVNCIKFASLRHHWNYETETAAHNITNLRLHRIHQCGWNFDSWWAARVSVRDDFRVFRWFQPECTAAQNHPSQTIRFCVPDSDQDDIKTSDESEKFIQIHTLHLRQTGRYRIHQNISTYTLSFSNRAWRKLQILYKPAQTYHLDGVRRFMQNACFQDIC